MPLFKGPNKPAEVKTPDPTGLEALGPMLVKLGEAMTVLAGSQTKSEERHRELVEALKTVSTPSPEPEPEPEPVKIPALGDLRKAVLESEDGGASVLAQFVEGKLEVQRRELDRELGLHTASLADLSQWSAAQGKYEYAERFKGEIDKDLAGLPQQVRANPKYMRIAYEGAYERSVGRHSAELRAEAVEAAMRGVDKAGRPAIGTGAGTGASKDESTLDPALILGPAAMRALVDRYNAPVEIALERFATERGFSNGQAFLQSQNVPLGETTH